MRNATELANCIDVAMRRRPADLVIKGARFFNLATGELERADLALCGERIAAVGEGYEGLETLDATGLTAVPGFVDAHCHIESSLLTPYAWERLVLPHGVTAAVCDPHELANVGGAAAIDFFRRSAAGMLLRLQVQVPSCVPALPTESAGAVLDAAAIAPYAADAALAEFMNLPGLLGKAPDALAKLAAFSGRPIDGHAPLAEGDALNAICAAGLANDHESSAVPEALAKLRRGMTILIRAGSVARNLADLAPLLTLTLCDRLCLCTDDRDPLDIRDEGHLDAAIPSPSTAPPASAPPATSAGATAASSPPASSPTSPSSPTSTPAPSSASSAAARSSPTPPSTPARPSPTPRPSAAPSAADPSPPPTSPSRPSPASSVSAKAPSSPTTSRGAMPPATASPAPSSPATAKTTASATPGPTASASNAAPSPPPSATTATTSASSAPTPPTWPSPPTPCATAAAASPSPSRAKSPPSSPSPSAASCPTAPPPRSPTPWPPSAPPPTTPAPPSPTPSSPSRFCRCQ